MVQANRSRPIQEISIAMKTTFAHLFQLSACTALALVTLSSAVAQNNGELKLNNEAPKGKFVTLPPRLYSDAVMPAASSPALQT
jgi:hypothetical protein